MTFPDQLMHLIRTDEPLGPLVWLGIGGPARFFAEPIEESEIKRLVEAARERNLLVRILGSGSNLLVREVGVDDRVPNARFGLRIQLWPFDKTSCVTRGFTV